MIRDEQIQKVLEVNEREKQITKEENALIRKQLSDELLTSAAIERNTRLVKTKVNQLNYSQSLSQLNSPHNTEMLNSKSNLYNTNKEDQYIEMIDRWNRNKFISKKYTDTLAQVSPNALRKINHD